MPELEKILTFLKEYWFLFVAGAGAAWAAYKKVIVGEAKASVNKTDAEARKIENEASTVLFNNLTEGLKRQSDLLEGANESLANANKIIEELTKKTREYEVELKKRDDEKEMIEKQKKSAEIRCERQADAFRRLQNKSNVAYWETDSKGVAVFVSQKFRELMDLNDGDPLDAWTERVPAPHRKRILNLWEQSLKNEDASTAIEFPIETKTGVKIVRSTFVMIRDQTGNVESFMGQTCEMKV